MKPAKILIVEDKAVIAESIAAHLAAAGYEICGKASSGEIALAMIAIDPPDVILMDIKLDGKLDGIQTVEKIQADHDIPVIYLTDIHDKETINRAKHTHPANYLLKPFKKFDLLNAIEIAFFNASTGKEPAPGQSASSDQTLFTFSDRFFIKDNFVMQRIDIADVLWIEADRAYCTIKTVQKEYTQVGSLSFFTKKFSHPMLMRVHRSYIVNVDKVTAIRGNMLIVGDEVNKPIPMSDSHKSGIHERFTVI
jgi:DNA-binding LytR/AlgR family response regulator